MRIKQNAFDITDNHVENVIERPIEQLVPDSMMPYSEYVILDRALPRVEDGLKPVQRRILYTFHSLGVKPDGSYIKSARVVGECMGKYHPHGDKSIYDAMVRMAQDFNMRMTLVDGHGNFGTAEGDPPAAMRYTEVKLDKLATELLKDLEKGTVSWHKNFDDSLQEPDVLPGRLPNLLVNGATGIAIGLATNIPTHNLSEVIDGIIAVIEHPSIKLKDLVEIIKGPDFPSGGFMLGGQGILEMYEKGHGKVVLRARADIENAEGNKQNIVVTELPYNVNKDSVQKKIFELKEDKKDGFENILDVADESDRNGMRIVIKLKRGENADLMLNKLYIKTGLQSNFNVNMVAIAGGKPKQMGLIEIIKHYIEFQKSVILKRSQHEAHIAKKREHILEGLLIAIPNIDEVIAIIRRSASRNEAKTELRHRFEISGEQAEAILNLQLGNINKLDVVKFEKELKELKVTIERLTKIIGSVREQLRVIKNELTELKDSYKSKRLTVILDNFKDLEVQAFDPTKRAQKRGIVAIDIEGGIKMLSARNYTSSHREASESGIEGLSVSLAKAEPNDTTLVFGSKGNCYRVTADNLQERKWTEKGLSLRTLFDGGADKEKAVKAITLTAEQIEKGKIYLYTKNGYVKTTAISQYIVNKDVYQVMVLRDGDEVIGAEIVDKHANVMFVTSDGLCIHTIAEGYSVQGRIAGGVAGANLNAKEQVVWAGQTTVEGVKEDGKLVYHPVGEIVVLSSKGMAKRVIAREFNAFKRDSKGIRIIDLQTDDNKVIFACKVLEPYEIAIVDKDNELTSLDTESIMLDTRTSKGRAVIAGKKIKKAVKHVSEVE
ncbi:MAG: DNA topoisomerase 4 subunit A [Firmicutes bacterium]|nr:DNA topoisomerase 4 subunit A [Bacillota bacterium]